MAEVSKKSDMSIDEILRPQTRLDLIFDVDLINDYIDVRSAMVQDMTQNHVIISQADPPILKSMVGRSLEATFVRRDPITTDKVRWGWRCQILEIIPNYKSVGPGEAPFPAVALSIPPIGGLTETNARMDYRLSITSEKKITIQTHPSFGRVALLDFSAGGVLIGIPRPPQAKVGMRLWFTLFFPVPSSPGQQMTINGEAEVVRVTTHEGEQFARAGLKFLDLDLSATRALQKAINFYMLEEQRGRNRNTVATKAAAGQPLRPGVPVTPQGGAISPQHPQGQPRPMQSGLTAPQQPPAGTRPVPQVGGANTLPAQARPPQPQAAPGAGQNQPVAPKPIKPSES